MMDDVHVTFKHNQDTPSAAHLAVKITGEFHRRQFQNRTTKLFTDFR